MEPPSPPAAERAAPRGAGCLKAALIGCGVAAAAVVAFLIVAGSYVKSHPEAGKRFAVKMVTFALGQVRRQFGPDVTEQDRSDFDRALARFEIAMRNNPEALRGSSELSELSRRPRGDRLSHEDVRQLIQKLNALADRARVPGSP